MANNNGADTETYTIEGPDGTTEDVQLPSGLAASFAEDDEPTTAVASDFLVQAFAQQSHAVVHHAQGESPIEPAVNEQMEALFEERFGVSLAEAMGHDH